MNILVVIDQYDGANNGTTITIGLGKKTKVNDQIYYLFRDKFFNRFTHIHCPSKLIADELLKHGYTALKKSRRLETKGNRTIPV